MQANTAAPCPRLPLLAARPRPFGRVAVGLLLAAVAGLTGCGLGDDDDPEAYCEGRILVLEYKGERTECPEACAEDRDRGVAQCVTADREACTESVCSDDDRTAVPCGALGLIEARTTCGAEEVCTTGRWTAECVAKDRQPCGEGHVCTADGALATCGETGFALAGASACAEGLVCHEWGYANVDVALPRDAECVLSQLVSCARDVCIDEQSVGVCGESGMVIARTPCSGATSCIFGRCVANDHFLCGEVDCPLDQVCLARRSGQECYTTGEGYESCDDTYSHECGPCPEGTECGAEGTPCNPDRTLCGPGLDCLYMEGEGTVCQALRE